MTTASSQDHAFAQQVVDKTIYGYALEYIYLDGNKQENRFSFRGHNYLIAMYQDNHPYQVVSKGAQLGASVLGMVRAFFVCDKLGMNVIYFFPTDEDVRDFSKTRVAPLIKDSPHLKAIVQDVDSVAVRQVGRGFLYFRGMRSSIRVKSTPADFLVFDELDEVDANVESISLAEKRLNHSRLKWRYMLSTPTVPDYGIDAHFKRSDQRYWNVICKQCDNKNILEKQFPECIKQISDVKAILICGKCSAQLDPGYGLWIAEEPTRERVRGYHLCGLVSPYADFVEMLEILKRGNENEVEQLYRNDLGLAYVSADRQLTIDIVKRCCERYGMHDTGRHSYMGVDQRGRELHVVIRQRNEITRKPEVILIKIVETFHDLDELMLRYDVDMAVVDGVPNQHSAREFARRFPGRVYMQYFNHEQRGSAAWSEPKKAGDDWMVTVNRTEALDNMFEEITRREVMLPSGDLTVVNTFAAHLTKLVRIHEKDNNDTVKTAIYKKVGEDHFSFAMANSLIAMSKFGAPATGIVVQSQMIGIDLVSRHYEDGSMY